MIPRHSLPFGINTTLAALLKPALSAQVPDVEKAYADALGVHAVVLLPSVRSGIHLALLAVNKPGMIVAGPAYTCHTVHDAMALSEARTLLVDAGPGSFLIPSDAVNTAMTPGCALVLSEVYGIPYDRDLLQNPSGKGLSVRVLDMAMSIPTPARMRQLEARDVALFSFGWGKPMYAGWGGIACFQDSELAGSVRLLRDRWIAPESFLLRLQHGSSTLLQVSLNQRSVYGLLHQRHFYRLYKNTFSKGKKQGSSPIKQAGAVQVINGRPALPLPQEWTLPMTALNRNLALHNLRYSVQHADLRRRQAEIYSRTLVESGIVRGAGSAALPQSHFPIRLPHAVRDKMGDYLRDRGIDTSTLFPLPAGVSRNSFPHAAKAADEVIALPLGPALTLDDARMISRCCIDGLRTLGV